MAVMLLLVTRRFYPVSYEYIRIIHAVIIIAMMFIVWTFFADRTGILGETVLLILYPLIVYFTGFFDSGEKEKIRSTIKMILR
jgi:hypothetical protein